MPILVGLNFSFFLGCRRARAKSPTLFAMDGAAVRPGESMPRAFMKPGVGSFIIKSLLACFARTPAKVVIRSFIGTVFRDNFAFSRDSARPSGVVSVLFDSSESSAVGPSRML